MFVSNGLCILIHAEEARVLLGFWRGKRLAELDPRIKPSGKYELGNITLPRGTPIDPADITGSIRRGLNADGDPTKLA